jgi:hypothetical protein
VSLVAVLGAAVVSLGLVAYNYKDQLIASEPVLGKKSPVVEAWEKIMREHNMTVHGQISPEDERNLSPETQESPSGYPASCVINSAIALFKLMQAGTTVAQAADSSCHIAGLYEGFSGDPYSCAVDALGAIHSFGFAATFLAAIAASCPLPGAVGAACASHISAIISATVESVQGLMAAARDCNMAVHEPETPSGMNPTKGTWCAVNVGAGLSFLAQAGDFIRFAVKDCENDLQKECAADILGVIASMGAIVAYLSSIGRTCVEQIKIDAQGASCAADIGTADNGLFSIAQSGILVGDACTGARRRLLHLGNSSLGKALFGEEAAREDVVREATPLLVLPGIATHGLESAQI